MKLTKFYNTLADEKDSQKNQSVKNNEKGEWLKKGFCSASHGSSEKSYSLTEFSKDLLPGNTTIQLSLYCGQL